MKTAKSFILPIILATLFFTSCSDYDNDYTVNQIQYEKAFYDVFGEIDPNQDWNLVKQLAEQGKNTRVADPNSNMWADTWAVPDEYKENQKAIIRLFFQHNHEPQGVSIKFPDFFAQQIYKGYDNNGSQKGPHSEERYKAADGNSYIVGSEHMDHLTVGSNHEHINNFNSGNGGMMLMLDANTDCFGYWNSSAAYGHDDRFVIVSGETILAWAQSTEKGACGHSGYELCQQYLSGAEAIKDGYFLGFDFDMLPDTEVYTNETFIRNGKEYHYIVPNTNQYCGTNYKLEAQADETNMNNYDEEKKARLNAEIDRLLAEGYLPISGRQFQEWVKVGGCNDGYYSDWIIGITPGLLKDGSTAIESALLVCEDLGDHDFDFNDIVLLLQHKRKINSDQTQTDKLIITAMAAGGTIPSYIYYKPLRGISESDKNKNLLIDNDNINLPEGDYYDDWQYLWTWHEFAGDTDEMSNGIHHMWSYESDNFNPLNVDSDFEGMGYSWEIDITGAIEVIKQSSDENIRKYADSYVSYVFDYSRIQIRVGSQDETTATIIQPIAHGVTGDTPSYLSAKVPQMMLLPMTYEWAQECKFIGDAYPDFIKWVQSKDETGWYRNQVRSLVTKRYVDDIYNGNGDDSDTTTPDSKIDPSLQWTNEISIVESTTTISYETNSNGNVWHSLNDNNLADVTLDTYSKTLTITPKANASGTLIITLHQDAIGNFNAKDIIMKVQVEKKDDTGKDDNTGEKEDTQDGTPIQNVGEKLYNIKDILNVAGDSDFVTITFITDNPNYDCCLYINEGTYIAYDSNPKYSEDHYRTSITVPVSWFKTTCSGFDKFHIRCNNNITALYVKPTSSSAKHRTTRR